MLGIIARIIDWWEGKSLSRRIISKVVVLFLLIILLVSLFFTNRPVEKTNREAKYEGVLLFKAGTSWCKIYRLETDDGVFLVNNKGGIVQVK